MASIDFYDFLMTSKVFYEMLINYKCVPQKITSDLK